MIEKILGGRYEILEEVGMGGMAHVYKARCHLLNRIVAIKMLRNDLEGGEEFIQRFNREAQSAAGLTHPNIVSIYDVGEDNGNHYIVMEYMEGITLKEYIKQKGKLDSHEAAYIASEICSALEAAHDKNIVHRDIKPHNIMITTDNRVKVTDFGIARASNNATMHVGDSILGSVHYISPEQARGGYVDCKSDIYSLGIVFYEMLTGRVPFESDSPIAVAMKHLEEKPVPPTELEPDIPKEIEDIVLKAMYKETRNRYQTVSEMKADIEAVMNKSVITEPATEPEEEIEGATRVIPIVSGIEVSDDIAETTEEEIKNAEDKTEEVNNGVYQVMEAQEPEEKEVEEAEEKKKGSVANMLFAAILISFLLVGTLSIGITWLLYPELPIFNLFSNSDITVPNFVGYDFEEAKEKAQDEGLIVEYGDSISSAMPVNTVVEQTIKEGRKVKRGERIVVYVSKGPADLDTSAYVGKKEKEVVEDLKSRGYKVSIKREDSTDISEDCVIKVKRNGVKITVYVSNGFGDIEVVVPNVVGKKLDVAKEMLEDLHLELDEKDIEYVDSDIFEDGIVIKQDIADGERVSPKTKIKVTVSGKPDSGNATDNGKKQKLITISLPEDRESVHVRVVTRPVGGSTETEIYEATLNTRQKQEFDLKVMGASKVELVVYFDGAVASTKTIDFTK